MAADIPTKEPTTFQAGTTLLFTKALADFPADTWTLTYELRSHENAPLTITATADGTGHTVTVAYGTTVDWNAGDYLMVGYATSATEKHQVYSGRLTVDAYAAGEDVYEWRSYAEQMLDKIELVISGSMSRNDISYSINGRSFTVKSDADLLAARNYFKAEVAAEKRTGHTSLILTQYTNPR